MNGITGNFAMKAFMENFFDSSDFEPKLPFRAGFDHLTNFSITDKYLPIAAFGVLGVPTDFLVEVRVLEKLAGKKAFTYSMTLRFYGKFIRK